MPKVKITVTNGMELLVNTTVMTHQEVWRLSAIRLRGVTIPLVNVCEGS
jgi:hypothetical protein